MIKKGLLVGMLILMAAIPATFPTYAQTQSLSVSGVSFGPSSSPVEVEAGSYNVPLFIYLTALQNSAVNVSVTVSSTNVFKVISEPQNVSFIPSGSTVPSIAYVNVSNKIASGIYSLPIFIRYKTFNGATENFTYTAELPVSTFASMQVYSVYWGSGGTLAYPGAVNLPLTLVLRNAGSNVAYNATVSISLLQPFTTSSGNHEVSQFIGAVPAGSTVPLEVYLNVNSKVSLGYYPMNVTLTWNDGISSNQTVYVPVFGSPNIVVQGYSINPPQILPGTSDAELYVSLVNSGNISVSNVNVNVSTTSPISLVSSPATTIGVMPPGTPAQLTYLINVNDNASSPSSAIVNVYITYNGVHAKSSIILPISPRASINVSPAGIALSQGASDVNVYYTLHNYGNVTAKDVQAQLILPNTVSGNTYDYVGDIPPGTSTIATFSLDVASSAPTGTYSATMDVTWQQSNAQGQGLTSRIPITFTVQQSFINEILDYISSPPALYIVFIIVAVLVAAVTGLVVSRRRASP